MIDIDECEDKIKRWPDFLPTLGVFYEMAKELLEEVKRLRRQIKVAQGVFEHLYDDELEDASWIRWFCNMEDEEE